MPVEFNPSPSLALEQALAVRSLAFSPGGDLLAAGGGNSDDGPGEVRLWDLREAARAGDGGEGARGLALSVPDDTGGGGAGDAPGPGFGSAVSSVAFSPGGETLAVAELRGNVTLWSARTGELLRRLDDPASPDPGRDRVAWGRDESWPPDAPWRAEVESLAFSPGGEVLAVATGNEIQLWDPASGRLVRSIAAAGASFLQVLFVPGGGGGGGGDRALLAGLDVEWLRLWDPDSGAELGTLVSYFPLFRAAFSPRGDRLAVVGHTDPYTAYTYVGLHSYSLGDGGRRPAARAEGRWPIEGAGQVCFSPDGARLAVGRTGVVELYDPYDGALRQTLGVWSGFGAASYSCNEGMPVAFSADGRALAGVWWPRPRTPGSDRRPHVYVWDAR